MCETMVYFHDSLQAGCHGDVTFDAQLLGQYKQKPHGKVEGGREAKKKKSKISFMAGVVK